jgi:hypothetical protein
VMVVKIKYPVNAIVAIDNKNRMTCQGRLDEVARADTLGILAY